MTNKNITNLSEYLDIINNLLVDWKTIELWFRGVEDINYDLIPSLYRRKFEINFEEEVDLYSDFARKAKAFIPDYNKLKPFDWYILMQHYSFPTRLLDWTTGSLIALFFAVRNTEIESDRSVHIIDPFDLNSKFHKMEQTFCCDELKITDYNRILEYLPINHVPEFPIAIEPPFFDRRIVAQRSCFTIHGNNRKSLNLLFEENNIKNFKINIAELNVIEIKEQLSLAGISESLLFPDLEGLSRELIFHHVID